MDWKNGFGRFKFHDDGIFDEQVDAISSVDLHAFKCDGECHLLFDIGALPAQHVR